MDFTQAVKTCLNKFAAFDGRARRSEYWYFFLIYMLVQVAAAIVEGILGLPLSLILSLVLLLPTLAVNVRRLHDLEKSGWWYLLVFVPLIGALVLLYWATRKGTPGPNRFGEDPLGDAGPYAPAQA